LAGGSSLGDYGGPEAERAMQRKTIDRRWLPLNALAVSNE
jgi:hypothetical protein